MGDRYKARFLIGGWICLLFFILGHSPEGFTQLIERVDSVGPDGEAQSFATKALLAFLGVFVGGPVFGYLIQPFALAPAFLVRCRFSAFSKEHIERFFAKLEEFDGRDKWESADQSGVFHYFFYQSENKEIATWASRRRTRVITAATAIVSMVVGSGLAYLVTGSVHWSAWAPAAVFFLVLYFQMRHEHRTHESLISAWVDFFPEGPALEKEDEAWPSALCFDGS